jgi:transcriptional regulator GlxA family with amidase domain
VLFDEVDLLDFAGPLQVLTLAGKRYNWRPFKVATVAVESGPVRTRNQLVVLADLSIRECQGTEILLVPGGYGARRALESSELIQWIRRESEKAELVGAVGYGSLLLAKAGVLDGLEVAIPGDIGEAFAELAPSARPLADRSLLDAGRVVTAKSSAGGLDLGLWLVARTLGDKIARQVGDELGHVWSAAVTEVPRIHIR